MRLLRASAAEPVYEFRYIANGIVDAAEQQKNGMAQICTSKLWVFYAGHLVLLVFIILVSRLALPLVAGIFIEQLN